MKIPRKVASMQSGDMSTCIARDYYDRAVVLPIMVKQEC